MYPAFVAMPLRFTRWCGLDPGWAFAATNVALLLTALALASRRLSWTGLCLLFLSPVIWWVDKIHYDVLRSSLLTMAMCSLPGSPITAGVAALPAWPRRRLRRSRSCC